MQQEKPRAWGVKYDTVENPDKWQAERAEGFRSSSGVFSGPGSKGNGRAAQGQGRTVRLGQKNSTARVLFFYARSLALRCAFAARPFSMRP